ncbi:unnamed protein product [Nippostrongylus brasiliensis]|uniref:Beta-lactamase domain-containing protein n=1 Tax=Nippostrongylus brasiliensis TaxID=27835 RepID=A0A0N4YAF5_NIPBR|nr:unnamed protein product [Nippostrongylus brasiliensis]
MGLFRLAIALGAVTLVAHFVANNLYSQLPLHFDGESEKGFEEVKKAFEQNFIDGWEIEGASLAVFLKGRKVVDIWGGYADKQAARLWKKDTMAVTFSTTKAVAAVCVAMLADRGRLKYDDLVSKHWPAFAKNGKGNITIEWVMSHMAGLPYFDATIAEDMAMDHNHVRQLIENESPKIPPGASSGYHAISYGWLVDQIVRHTDEQGRGIGQFLREEITKPFEIDYHVGLNSSEEHRVARSTLPKVLELLGELWHDPSAVHQIINFVSSGKDSAVVKTFSTPSWIDVVDKCTVNNPDHHAMEQPALLGIGNARSLASIFSLLVNGRLVKEDMLRLLNKPVIRDTDYILKVPTVKGHGFFYSPMESSAEHPVIGHSGHGCQQVTFDTKNKLSFAYVTNGLKAGVFEHCRNYMRIHKAVYDTVSKLQA